MLTEPQVSVASTPSQAPTAPVTITTSGAAGGTQTIVIPKTAAEMRELRTQRDELSEQLTNVAARRRDLAEELQSFTDGATRTGLEGRLNVLDQRIVQLETDLATTGRQISSASAELIGESETTVQPDGDGVFGEGLAVGGVSMLAFALLVFFFMRKRWTRGSLPTADGESGKRLERLELGMEAIAVEIERISEGQRFVTRLLSESQVPVPAQPAAIAAHSSTKTSVGQA